MVLGATGHLGQALIRALISGGYRVTAATRQHNPSNLRGLDVQIITGDDRWPGQLARWVQGHGLVVDAAAPYPLGSYALYGMQAPHVFADAEARTRCLLEAVQRERARLVFISAFTTLPRPEADTSAALRRTLYPYFEVKAGMERMVQRAAAAGLPAVIVNPSACLGPWDRRHSEASLVHQALSGSLPAVARDVINVVDVRDLAAAVLRALEQQLYARPIAITGHNLPLSELVERICELGGAPAPLWQVDARTVSMFALWAEAALACANREIPMQLHAAPLIADALPMEISREQLALGIEPRPLGDTLRDAVAWQRDGSHPRSMR